MEQEQTHPATSAKTDRGIVVGPMSRESTGPEVSPVGKEDLQTAVDALTDSTWLQVGDVYDDPQSLGVTCWVYVDDEGYLLSVEGADSCSFVIRDRDSVVEALNAFVRADPAFWDYRNQAVVVRHHPGDC